LAGFLSAELMSDEPEASSEKPQDPTAGNEPRVRRISNPRPKKAAKRISNKPAAETVADAPDSELAPTGLVVSSEKIETAAPVAEPVKPEIVAESPDSSDSDWAEAEPASVGGAAPSEGSKKKRRRKKGKGGGVQNNAGVHTQGPSETPVAMAGEPAAPPAQPSSNLPQHQHQQRHRVDPELLAKRAWKIYLAEISEEGVALVGDGDARELSRRCFRLAEIFLEEQARRR
jgi:hypothetical protein